MINGVAMINGVVSMINGVVSMINGVAVDDKRGGGLMINGVVLSGAARMCAEFRLAKH